MKYILLFLLIINLMSCSKGENTVINYNKNGKLISKTYPSLELSRPIDSIIYFKNNKVDYKVIFKTKEDVFVKYYDPKEKLICEGNTTKKMRNGKWKYYRENGSLDKVIEYINLCGQQYVNQGWYFKENGDTIYRKSNFVNIKISNGNFKINEKHEFKFSYKKILGPKSEFMLMISPDVDDKFCNIEKINISKQYSKVNQIIAKIGFATAGKKTLRGYITEFQDSIISGEKMPKIAERRVYFQIPIVVE